jgi:hypothetical protein
MRWRPGSGDKALVNGDDGGDVLQHKIDEGEVRRKCKGDGKAKGWSSP